MQTRFTFRAILIGSLALLLIAPEELRAEDAPQPDGWLGIYYTAVESLPVIEEQAGGGEALGGATAGLVVDAVFPHSPAEGGGLLEGDIIVAMGGEPFTCLKDSVRALFRRRIAGMVGDPRPMRVIRNAVARMVSVNGEMLEALEADRFWLDARAFSDSLASGGSMEARASRKQEVLDLDVVLGPRPEAKWPEAPVNEFLSRLEDESPITPLAWNLIDQADIRSDCEDLFMRLASLHDHSDPLRHEALIFAHRNPFLLEALVEWGTRYEISRSTYSEPFGSETLRNSYYNVKLGSLPGIDHWMKLHRTSESYRKERLSINRPLPRIEMSRQEKLDTFLAWVEAVLADIDSTNDSIFSSWNAKEKDFVEKEIWGLSDAFAKDIYIHFDRDRPRFEKNRKLIDLAAGVDYVMMKKQYACALRLHAPPIPFAEFFGEILSDSLDREYLVNRETPCGRIIVAGTGNNWHQHQDVAFLIDLGGDDFYTGNAGGSRGFELPVSVCIDLSGNDAYESTERGAQGSGILGIGILIDHEGDDTYIGKEWCQGTGFFGIGLIKDIKGNDTYRGRAFCQGAGLFGRGYLLEISGDDRYEGDCKVQGVGLAGGIGAIFEEEGSDQYYAKGLTPTGYGTSGIFDSWSQGCGMGFRTLASGGIGMVIDGGGSDRMEAGNFSQGGGYYYGMGIVSAGGDENDVYIGSRYNQGFSAHQAIGVFLEEGGNDFYTTRHGVAQGLAWDECVTLFIDRNGNDIYEGGHFFSQGASAHNSVCFFVDRAGRDEYRYAPGPARSGANTYHGGTSLSLFLDSGFQEDLYTSEHARNRAVLYKPEHGFFLDLFGGIGKASEDKIWKKLESGE